MKRIIAFALSLSVMFFLSGCFFDDPVKNNPIFTDFDKPFEAKLEKVDDPFVEFYDISFPKNPWDMQVYDNKIFIGAGDYDRNTGCVDMKYYDTKKDEMCFAGAVGSEQISNFYLYDNAIYTVPIDPVEWGVGDYYKYKKGNDQFDIYTVLPQNIHCFDMIKFDKKYFFCGSVINNETSSMIMYIDEKNIDSDSRYDTKDIWLYKDGEKIEPLDCIRVYDLFEFKGKLYAWHFLGYKEEMYVYNKEKCRFDFCNDKKTLMPVIEQKAPKESYSYISHDFSFAGHYCFINQGMKYTDDLVKYKTVNVGKGFVIRDAIMRDGYLYLLASKKIGDKNYQTAVFLTDDLKDFHKMCYFTAQSYMISFEYCNGIMLFGEGGLDGSTLKSIGNIYKFDLKK